MCGLHLVDKSLNKYLNSLGVKQALGYLLSFMLKIYKQPHSWPKPFTKSSQTDIEKSVPFAHTHNFKIGISVTKINHS